jgi:hypothetical protein
VCRSVSDWSNKKRDSAKSPAINYRVATERELIGGKNAKHGRPWSAPRRTPEQLLRRSKAFQFRTWPGACGSNLFVEYLHCLSFGCLLLLASADEII